MADDLFDIPARARRSDPETSHAAAEAIDPHTATIRRQVEAFAHGQGARGFIDEEMSKAFQAEDVSSYRTRRAELVVAGTIIDSGRRQRNDGGRECIVWVHKVFAGVIDAPPRKPLPRHPDTDSLRGSFELLEACIDRMGTSGWMVAAAAKEALATIRKATGSR